MLADTDLPSSYSIGGSCSCSAVTSSSGAVPSKALSTKSSSSGLKTVPTSSSIRINNKEYSDLKIKVYSFHVIVSCMELRV